MLHAPPELQLGGMVLGGGLAAMVVLFLLSWWVFPRLRRYLPFLSIPVSLVWLFAGAFFLTGSSTVTFVSRGASVRIEERRLVFKSVEERPTASILGARVERTLLGAHAIELVGTQGGPILTGYSDGAGYDEAANAIEHQLGLR